MVCKCFPECGSRSWISQLGFQRGRADNRYSGALALALLLQQTCESERTLVNRNRQTRAGALAKNSSSFLEGLDGVTKFDRFIDTQQMVSMFVKTMDAFGCQPATKRKNEVVVPKLSFDFTMRDSYVSFERIDARNFRFNKINSPVQHRPPQVKQNVLLLALAKSQPDQRRIENEIPATRHEGNLMLVAKLRGQTLSRYHTTKSAAQDEYSRHLY